MRIKSLQNYLKRLFRWLWLGKYHILSFIAVILTVFYLIGLLNFYPDLVSVSLSLTGLFIILTQQILDVREFADHKPNTIRNWIKSFPTKKLNVISMKGSAFLTSFAKAHLKLSISEDATIENKVDFLLRQIDNVQSSIDRIDNLVDDLTNSFSEKSKELKTDLDNFNTSLKTIIAGHIVGSYDINLFGITITICGVLIQFFNS